MEATLDDIGMYHAWTNGGHTKGELEVEGTTPTCHWHIIFSYHLLSNGVCTKRNHTQSVYVMQEHATYVLSGDAFEAPNVTQMKLEKLSFSATSNQGQVYPNEKGQT